MRLSIASVDRLFYHAAPVFGHQGSYYQDAFDDHGVDTTLDWWCDACPCSCHESWYCPLVRFFCGCRCF